MTRIYQLDEIDQDDIDQTQVIPAEDSAGNETVKMTISQLGRYLFCKAGTNGEGGMFEGQEFAIGNASFAHGTYSTAVGPYNNAGGEGGETNQYCNAFGYNNRTNASQNASAFGYANTASGNNSSAFGYENNSNDSSANAFGNNNNATGEASNAFGVYNTASGYGSTAVGYNNDADDDNSTAVGYNNNAQGQSSTAIGYENNAYGNRSTAIGSSAYARNDDTVNIGGSIVVRADNSEDIDATANFAQFSGVQNIVLSKSVDLTTSVSIGLNVPSNCSFYVDECGIILANEVTSVSVQPTVKFGFNSTDAGLSTAAITTTLSTPYGRHRITNILNIGGVTVLTATITSPATATTLKGRFYFKGMLVENTPLD